MLRLTTKETKLLQQLLLRAEKNINLNNDTCKLFKFLVDDKIELVEKKKVLNSLTN